MFIDVIIPTFNRAPYLIRAIESVLNQSYQNFVLYIIDDGSTDDSRTLIQPYLSNQKVHYLYQENKGVSAARNTGIRNSQSPWLAFLDSDDEWLSHKLKTQIEFIKNNSELRFIHSNEIWMRNDVRVNPKLKFDKSHHDLFRRSLETCLISPSTVMIKRDLLIEHNLFDEQFPICEDYDLWLKVLSHENIGFISDNLIRKFGGHEDQLSTKFPAMDFWRILSMTNLLKNERLDPEKRALVINEINRKAPVLIMGYEKHQNHEQKKLLLNLIQSNNDEAE